MKQQDCVVLLKKLGFALMLLTVLLLPSCKTIKNNESASLKASVQVQENAENHTQKVDTTKQRDSSTTVITDTYFSKPDSTGKQHVERVVKTEQRKVSVQNKGVSEKTDSNLEKATKTKTAYKKQQSSNSETKTSSAFNLVAIILSLGVVLLVFLVLWRYGIIKLKR